MLSNDYQSLEDLRPLAGKCPRCSLCKFPPLSIVESKEHSGICPSYEEFKFHSSSGGGMLVMAMSLLDGRSTITPAVQKAVYGCTACGGCDVACKYNSDIELQEIILHLRAKLFAQGAVPPALRAVLDSIRIDGHPLPGAAGSRGAWLGGANLAPGGCAPVLLWVGPHYALRTERRPTLLRAVELLRAAQVPFAVLGDEEPYTGRAALEIGDRALFRQCAERAVSAIRSSGAQAVVCLSAEDYATLRSAVPLVAAVPVPVRHVTEIYADAIRAGRLQPRWTVRANAAWHDSSYLGRLSNPWVAWSGTQRKVLGQVEVTEPEKPLNYGSAGCFEPPRAVLRSIPGVRLLEMHRRREYAFDSGETGQAHALFPNLTLHTAQRRLREAAAVAADMIACECPQSVAALEAGLRADPDLRLRVATITDLLAESVFGGDQLPTRGKEWS